MIYPEFLKEGQKIGVCAPSHAIGDEKDRLRFENAKKKLKKKGHDVIFTDHVFCDGDYFGRSADGRTKALEFDELVKNEEVGAVISASGGDFLSEMLPYIDIKNFKKNPKWVQGYSDNTALLYYLTTCLDVATMYGANFGDFGMENWQLSVKRNLDILEGKEKVQNSFSKFQDGFSPRSTGLEGYDLKKKVNWKILSAGGEAYDTEINNMAEYRESFLGGKEPDVKVSAEGRLLGGCLDVIANIAGTPFDGTKKFLKKYKDNGIIWYLESFDLPFEGMMETLWKLDVMGYFEGVRAFVFGRPLFYKNEDFSGEKLPEYKEVLLERLLKYKVPIILDADIGHKGPQFVMINGAMARVEAEGGRGSVIYTD